MYGANMFLSDFVAEAKVIQTCNQVKQRLQEQGLDVNNSEILKQLRYTVYSKISRMAKVITEPLVINAEENWEEWVSKPLATYILSVSNGDWDSELCLVAMRQGDGYILHLTNTGASCVRVQSFFFTKDLLLSRILIWDIEQREDMRIVSPKGTNFFILESPVSSTKYYDSHHFDSLSGSKLIQHQIFKREN